MSLAAVLVPGALLAIAGFAFVLFPARYMSAAEATVIAGGTRLAIGAFLPAGAGTARHSMAVMTLSGLVVLAALALLLLPRSCFDSRARRALGLSSGVVRFASVAAAVCGCRHMFTANGSKLNPLFILMNLSLLEYVPFVDLAWPPQESAQ